jgi:hypothetical protein
MAEPFLEGLVHPDQIFLYLFQGANVGDAVVHSTRWLKWMILNLGDPLYTPFPGGLGPYKSPTYHGTWFGISPNDVAGGGTALGTFVLSETVGKVTPVAAKSTNPELVTLPSEATIPATGNGVRFPIVTKSPKQPTSVTITVTAGNETLTNTLTIYPLLVDLTLSQPSIKSDGTVTGTVTISAPAQGQGPTITLSSSVAGLRHRNHHRHH